MVTRADITGTRPAAIVEPLTPITASVGARQETFNRLAQIELGRQLQATVLSRFDDGTFLVRVADTPARMNLPDGTKVGDTLQMTILANTPRPTFLLGAETGSVTTTLSSAGRMIDTVLNAARQTGAPAALAGKTPLLPSPSALLSAASPPQTAAALHDTLGFSGLFYESHLHEWLNGSRTQTDIMQEPQARAGESSQFGPTVSREPPAPTSELIAKIRELTANGQSPADMLKEWQVQTGNPAVTDADTIARMAMPAAMSADSMQTIHRQLHVLEQRQFVWHGELFPGLPMEWQISEDTPHRDPNDAGSMEPVWQSIVRFDFPALGKVAATIRLTGQRVQVEIRTFAETTATSLRTHGNELAVALNAAGSPLDSLSVNQDEKA